MHILVWLFTLAHSPVSTSVPLIAHTPPALPTVTRPAVARACAHRLAHPCLRLSHECVSTSMYTDHYACQCTLVLTTSPFTGELEHCRCTMTCSFTRNEHRYSKYPGTSCGCLHFLLVGSLFVHSVSSCHLLPDRVPVIVS